jgi:hypothetical protein
VPAPPPADRIPAGTDKEARERYLGFLQQSLSAVHPHAVWRAAPIGEEMHSAFTIPPVIRLADGLFLRATQSFRYEDDERYEGDRKVGTAQYVYTLAEDEDLTQELFSWQWHPGEWAAPHLHVRMDRKLHIPTGRVAFEEVLLFAITDYGIATAKPDAAAILTDILSRFRRYRTWA